VHASWLGLHVTAFKLILHNWLIPCGVAAAAAASKGREQLHWSKGIAQWLSGSLQWMQFGSLLDGPSGVYRMLQEKGCLICNHFVPESTGVSPW
jgi:hypothetical protein